MAFIQHNRQLIARETIKVGGGREMERAAERKKEVIFHL